MTPPPKPKGMSEKRYRDLYDSTPHIVETPTVHIRCAGPISAEVVAGRYRAKGESVTVRPSEEDR